MLHELPATIYIGLGAIVAALITALITFVNLITSKDQIVSEHRQLWINSIREDISKYIGLTSHMSAIKSRYLSLKNEVNNEDEVKVLKRSLYAINADFYELFNRIILRLNPVENSEIIDQINLISDALEVKENNTDEVKLLIISLRDTSQEMLKKEWKRVKRGETSYLITKWVFIVLIGSSVAFGIYQLNHNTKKIDKVVEVSNTESPVIESTELNLPNKALKRN